jgi:hypothetical protein
MITVCHWLTRAEAQPPTCEVITNNIKDFRPLAAEWLAHGRAHAGLILLPSTRTRTRHTVAAVATAVANVLRAHPDGLSGSERWIGPLPNL